jgi:hypothetical protein
MREALPPRPLHISMTSFLGTELLYVNASQKLRCTFWQPSYYWCAEYNVHLIHSINLAVWLQFSVCQQYQQLHFVCGDTRHLISVHFNRWEGVIINAIPLLPCKCVTGSEGVRCWGDGDVRFLCFSLRWMKQSPRLDFPYEIDRTQIVLLCTHLKAHGLKEAFFGLSSLSCTCSFTIFIR